jgi:formamidopyrimidine-DNA glycosylase
LKKSSKKLLRTGPSRAAEAAAKPTDVFCFFFSKKQAFLPLSLHCTLVEMPELPEVETVMRGLAARLQGRRIVSAELRRPDLRWPVPSGLVARLTGASVSGFVRRGKYILMRLEGGSSVLLHLGMSGRMVIAAPGRDGEPPALSPLHEHLVMTTDEGWRIAFVDPRRFGSLDMLQTGEEASHRLLAQLGPEPLSAAFDAAVLSASLDGRKTPIKAALLDQRVVAGLGNIYVCEALFRARISPRRLAASVAGARATRLVPAIRQTLTEAIEAGGSTLRDYVQPSGELGYFQHAWKVYARAGQRCERCPGEPACLGISRIVQSGRSSFFCSRTQR